MINMAQTQFSKVINKIEDVSMIGVVILIVYQTIKTYKLIMLL